MRLKMQIDNDVNPMPIELENSPGFLKKQSGSGGG